MGYYALRNTLKISTVNALIAVEQPRVSERFLAHQLHLDAYESPA